MSGISFEENAEYWRGIARGVPEGARVAAEAMARYLAERAAYDTLQRTSHGAGEYWKAAPGAPPASASGNLAASMYFTRGTGGKGRAEAYVGNRALYAGMLEHGCHGIEPTHYRVMHWHDSEGDWYHPKLPAGGGDMPAHPFLGPTLDEAEDDGSLTQAAVDAFREYDP